MWLAAASDEDHIIAMWDDYKKISVNPGMMYIKTDKGRAELAGRSRALDAVQRRLLVLIDGNKTVNDLAVFVRVGELDEALDHLLREGLIESTDCIAPLQAPAAPGFAETAAAEEPDPQTARKNSMKFASKPRTLCWSAWGRQVAPFVTRLIAARTLPSSEKRYAV